MSDAVAPNTPSVVERTRRRGRRAGGGRAFPRPHRGVRARRGGGVAACRDKGESSALAIHGGGILSGRDRWRQRRHRRRRRQGVLDRRQGRKPARSRPMPSAAGSIRSRPVPTARWRGRPASSAFVQAGKGEPRSVEVQSTVGGLAFAPKGIRLADRPLQRRVDVVSERAGRARSAGVEGLAPSRCLQSERAVSGHGDAGAGVAWLARRRCQAHADVGLFGAGALVRLDRGRQVARHLGLRAARALAVPGQGRPDGQAAQDVRGRSPCASPPSPAIRSRRSSRSAMPTARCCWCGSTTAPRCWARSRAKAPVTALGWDAAGTLLAWGTEAGEAGVIDLG